MRSGKKMNNGQYIILLLYVDDILVMSKMKEDRYWVKEILQQEYEKITMDEGERLPYLGMTILKTKEGFKITMKTYIEDVLQLYGKDIKTCVTPAKPTLFEVTWCQQRVDGVVFHSAPLHKSQTSNNRGQEETRTSAWLPQAHKRLEPGV